MTKPTYEDALALIEAKGIQLYDSQKELLRAMLGNENYYFLPARGCTGRNVFLETIFLLTQLLIKENEDDNTRF